MVKKSHRWTQKDLEKLYPTWIDKERRDDIKKGRYGNVRKPVHDGIRFDSKREFLRYMDLKLLEKAGEISELKVHPKYPIIIGGIPIMVALNQYKPWGRHLTYEADFSYLHHKVIDGEPATKPIIEDVKMQSGHRTDVYKLKRALMKAMGIDITEY
jgi:hypothetical protein